MKGIGNVPCCPSHLLNEAGIKEDKKVLGPEFDLDEPLFAEDNSFVLVVPIAQDAVFLL